MSIFRKNSKASPMKMEKDKGNIDKAVLLAAITDVINGKVAYLTDSELGC